MDKSHLFPGEYETHHHHGGAGHAPHGQQQGEPYATTDRASPFDNHHHEDYFSTHLPSRPVTPMGGMDDNKDPRTGRHHRPRKIVLCFDGTGNKFQGDDSDSNILKIYRMLDRTADDQYHYYQPGIGTYVVSTSLTRTSTVARLRSWYQKSKDSAIGTSFDQHVVGGYRFLMRFYRTNDEIYIFGFSRGAYVARFLAEMLDYIGLLSHGNEEMVRFAWKAFSSWQARRSDDSPEGVAKKKKMYEFLKGFRETFSRPVRRIRFLGLFDTVNSVPQFESAWMGRSKFPYTARTSAKVVRHAVSIDERRAKFRQDLIYQSAHRNMKCKDRNTARDKLHEFQEKYRGRSHPHAAATAADGTGGKKEGRGRRPTLAVPEQEPAPYRTRSHSVRSSRTNRSGVSSGRDGPVHDGHSEVHSVGPHPETDDDGEDFEESEDEHEQDIDEVWFAGGHADIGGGWSVEEGQKPASHIPLCWMVREAMRAGLHFDPDKIRAMGCVDLMDDMGIEHGPDTNAKNQDKMKSEHLGGPAASNGNGVAKSCTCSHGTGTTGTNGRGNQQVNPNTTIPNITVRSPSTPRILQQSSWKLDSFSMSSFKDKDKSSGKSSSRNKNDKETAPDGGPGAATCTPTSPTTDRTSMNNSGTSSSSSDSSDSCPLHSPWSFHTMITQAHTALIHDSLSFSCGLSFGSVLAWKVMEYLPFRRLDLSEDGSWKPIRWPLPCGEVRDIPENAHVHGSVIKRMQMDETYRPGNLIIGGGGRGVRFAGREHGIGEWVCVKEEGDPVGEVWMKKSAVEKEKAAREVEAREAAGFKLGGDMGGKGSAHGDGSDTCKEQEGHGKKEGGKKKREKKEHKTK
ncbi:hypothetical protein QBC32DRAFT_400207 [Pseudoneurospora amorphoporcata]|uniref:T6SS Phospholipase effector Tle1-like catalytic domain-containing protein n=1 Tax=Pseudoneurospora amorphoporcata TaxID=241081 RepID=A0AAN6NR03_9PEZI|nr:hypothetical protein QBC32DRAFT_400207 [Pseudoneurospora amorphoporcata]